MFLRSNQHKKMPWKNGNGITYEIDRQPTNPDEELHWRLSMAEIKYPGGPFSYFPNIDRTLTIIDGQRLKLTLIDNQQSIEINRNSPPFSFQGETNITSEIYEDTIIDFNVMTKRNQYKHSLEKFIFDKKQNSICITNDKHQQILYILVVQGELRFDNTNLTKGDVIKLTDYQQLIDLVILTDETIIFIIKIIDINSI